ncbi:hypothetical protein AVEN_253064-1 [Araneus ventricosus]|uniref:Uncharacterized protein n=1 Tax=Araneus ventricosus TaxID=182803 RepID=A0A4Y2MID6_ARAVE|nr:hypothetical protein AVEN_253064-1 [Araneus ventricosus]
MHHPKVALFKKLLDFMPELENDDVSKVKLDNSGSKISNECVAHSYRLSPLQAVFVSGAQRSYEWWNLIKNHLEEQPTFLSEMMRTNKACFRVMTFTMEQVDTSG